jgi:hypothetical protein
VPSCASCACHRHDPAPSSRPSLPQHRVIEIAEISQRLVVMSSLGASTLADVCSAPDRIDAFALASSRPARLEASAVSASKDGWSC